MRKLLHSLKIAVYSICMLGMFSSQGFAQSTTINTTVGSTGYNGNNSSGTNGFITFVLENNSGVEMKITAAGSWATTGHNGTTSTIWYSPTSLSGPVTLSAPVWTSVTSNVVAGVTAPGVYPVLPNITNFTIPNGAIYRVAIHTTGVNNYTLGTATPNNFTAAGMTMYTGDYQIGGQNVGYAVGNNPRFFTGFVTFEPASIPCQDTLDSAKIFGPTEVCPRKPYNLVVGLSENLFLSGLTYTWEISNNQGQTWSQFTGVPNAARGGEITDSIITAERWYRCVIRCAADNNRTITTPIHKVKLAPFYYCYCDTRVRNDGSPDIGSITVIENTPTADTVFDNGNSNPIYNNNNANRSYTSYHDSLGGFPCMYRDTSYQFLITQIHAGNTLQNGVLQAYLDLDRNGSYDPATERILIKAIDGTGQFPEIVDEDFTIPASANVGPTGLRFVLSSDTLQSVPCDTLDGSGEVEDYIVEICYRPCDGPVPAGIAEAADTTMCVGYDYLVTDTTYADTVSGYNWSWQVSGDNSVWFDIPNTNKKDTLQRVFGGQPLYYRLMTVCPNTDDTAYSNGRLVDLKPSYKCYCFSQADGLDKDTSDIGGVDFAGVFTYNGGPHVLNPMAKNKRQDYTDRQPIEIVRDSAYQFTVYHTMRSAIHGDAKITIFLDYNNDKEYNTPDERVYTGFTTIGNHTVIDNVVVPLTAIVDVPTGMRVILNNDIGPNVPSDEGCGTYTSGETEDYIVIFRKKVPQSINENTVSLNGFGLHPNPTNGKFMVQFSSADKVSDLRVRVTNLTGQEVYSEDYGSHNGGFFSQELSIEGQPSGVYFVELQADGQQLIRKLILQ